MRVFPRRAPAGWNLGWGIRADSRRPMHHYGICVTAGYERWRVSSAGTRATETDPRTDRSLPEVGRSFPAGYYLPHG